MRSRISEPELDSMLNTAEIEARGKGMYADETRRYNALEDLAEARRLLRRVSQRELLEAVEGFL